MQAVGACVDAVSEDAAERLSAPRKRARSEARERQRAAAVGKNSCSAAGSGYKRVAIESRRTRQAHPPLSSLVTLVSRIQTRQNSLLYSRAVKESEFGPLVTPASAWQTRPNQDASARTHPLLLCIGSLHSSIPHYSACSLSHHPASPDDVLPCASNVQPCRRDPGPLGIMRVGSGWHSSEQSGVGIPFPTILLLPPPTSSPIT